MDDYKINNSKQYKIFKIKKLCETNTGQNI